MLENQQPDIAIWVGVICTFGIYSILYKENPYYRFAEHVFIGLATGLGVFLLWKDGLYVYWWKPMVEQGQWWWALAPTGGAMYYFIYSKKNAWITRLMIGSMMGLGAGGAFQDFANNFFPMIKGSFKPVIPTDFARVTAEPGVSLPQAASNLVFVIVLVTVMAYFFFSIDHKRKSMRGTASLGRWFLMFAFGAMFGATVMARMALFIGRLDFLTTEWGPIVPVWFIISLGGIIALVLGYFLFVFKPPKKLQAEPIDSEES